MTRLRLAFPLSLIVIGALIVIGVGSCVAERVRTGEVADAYFLEIGAVPPHYNLVRLDLATLTIKDRTNLVSPVGDAAFVPPGDEFVVLTWDAQERQTRLLRFNAGTGKQVGDPLALRGVRRGKGMTPCLVTSVGAKRQVGIIRSEPTAKDPAGRIRQPYSLEWLDLERGTSENVPLPDFTNQVMVDQIHGFEGLTVVALTAYHEAYRMSDAPSFNGIPIENRPCVLLSVVDQLLNDEPVPALYA